MTKVRDIDAEKLFSEFVGERLRGVREARGVRACFVGKKLGITAQQLWNYERGKVRITALKLRQMAQIYQCDMNDFCEGFKDIEGEGQ